MPFDPTKPASNTPANSTEMRAQLNALKALIDLVLPIGFIGGWAKNVTGVPALIGTWAECNGQVLSDAGSPLNGQTLPDLNGEQRFLRGASASGGTGGADTHSHDVDLSSGAGDFTAGSDAYAAGSGHVNTADASSLPSYYEVVWVMRIK
jgi:hypothetical protein